MKKIKDIKREIQIIELLGFNVSTPDKDNNYKIFNNKGELVGFIKYNKDGNKEERSYNDEYKHEYYMEIDNDELLVKTGVYCPDFIASPTTIYIYYKNVGTNVYLHMGPDFMAIRMHYFHSIPNNKILLFYIDENKFYFKCQEPYDYYFTPSVMVNLIEKSYTYDISFIDIKDVEHDYPLYRGRLHCQEINEDSKLIIKNSWNYWKGKHDNHNTYLSSVKGTIEDAIKKHQMGIDAFNRMRYLMNVPFKEDIIKFIIKNTEFELPRYLDLFIPEIKNQEKETTLISPKKIKKYKRR